MLCHDQLAFVFVILMNQSIIKFYIIKIKLLLIDKLKEYTWKRLKSNENDSFYMTHNSVHYMWFIPLQCDWIVDPDGWEASVIPLDWGWQRYLFAVQVTARESMNLNHDIIKNHSPHRKEKTDWCTIILCVVFVNIRGRLPRNVTFLIKTRENHLYKYWN